MGVGRLIAAGIVIIAWALAVALCPYYFPEYDAFVWRVGGLAVLGALILIFYEHPNQLFK